MFISLLNNFRVGACPVCVVVVVFLVSCMSWLSCVVCSDVCVRLLLVLGVVPETASQSHEEACGRERQRQLFSSPGDEVVSDQSRCGSRERTATEVSCVAENVERCD